MSKKNESKEILKIEKSVLHNEVIAIKKSLIDYKAERKASWKLFKHKTSKDLAKVKKSLDKLSLKAQK